VVIPTLRREEPLLETIAGVLATTPRPSEVLVVDQSPSHSAATTERLGELELAGDIRWLRLDEPSIPRAMNVGLVAAKEETVLFADDDIVPSTSLIAEHARVHASQDPQLVAGRVVQPWHEGWSDFDPESIPETGVVDRSEEFMGGNFSVKKSFAVGLGGFDENFVGAGYRFEAEFAGRLLAASGRILFSPAAVIKHLKVNAGGTRFFGEHLRTARPTHAVGAYYYLLRGISVPRRFRRLLARPLRSVRTRHHLRRPWWIPVTLMAEAGGLLWAVALFLRGPRYLTLSTPSSAHND